MRARALLREVAGRLRGVFGSRGGGARHGAHGGTGAEIRRRGHVIGGGRGPQGGGGSGSGGTSSGRGYGGWGGYGYGGRGSYGGPDGAGTTWTRRGGYGGRSSQRGQGGRTSRWGYSSRGGSGGGGRDSRRGAHGGAKNSDESTVWSRFRALFPRDVTAMEVVEEVLELEEDMQRLKRLQELPSTVGDMYTKFRDFLWSAAAAVVTTYSYCSEGVKGSVDAIKTKASGVKESVKAKVSPEKEAPSDSMSDEEETVRRVLDLALSP